MGIVVVFVVVVVVTVTVIVDVENEIEIPPAAVVGFVRLDSRRGYPCDEGEGGGDDGVGRRTRRRPRRRSETSVASQAALIAGTTVGGGFLALPAATAPCGAGPAALGLLGTWLFLLGCALSLSNAIFAMRRGMMTEEERRDSRGGGVGVRVEGGGGGYPSRR